MKQIVIRRWVDSTPTRNVVTKLPNMGGKVTLGQMCVFSLRAVPTLPGDDISALAYWYWVECADISAG